MTNVTNAAHAKPAHRDHLWVLAVIACFALYDIWEAWTQVGNRSGFAHGTGWTLTVIVEAFAGYSLFAWFSAPGQRSRRFAMCSAFATLTLSLIGQASAHLSARWTAPPAVVVVFVSSLPVITLTLMAILIHLRRLDRSAAEAAERGRAEAERAAAAETAAADERTGLRSELDALKAAQDGERQALLSDLEAARNAQEDAEKRAAEALTRAEKLVAKLEAVSAQRKRGKDGQRERKSAHDSDITTEFRALDEMEKDPSLRGPRMGAELARRLKVSEATGRRLHAKLTARGGTPESPTERSADPSDERS